MDQGESMEPVTEGREEQYSFGLTERQVLRLRDIIRRDSGVDLPLQDAWTRAIELIALARMLVEADLPADVRR